MLLPRFEEALAAERFASPPCEQIRTALIGLDPADALDHLRKIGLAEALAAVLGRGLTDIPPTTLPNASPEEAAVAVERALAGLHPERLEQEVAEARAALAADFCEANLRRVEALDRMRAFSRPAPTTDRGDPNGEADHHHDRRPSRRGHRRGRAARYPVGSGEEARRPRP
jgi:hypothetical protein